MWILDKETWTYDQVWKLIKSIHKVYLFLFVKMLDDKLIYSG